MPNRCPGTGRFISPVIVLTVVLFGHQAHGILRVHAGPEFSSQASGIVGEGAGGPRPGQAGEKRASVSPEARDRIRQGIAAVGIIWVRDPADSSTPNSWRRGSGVIIRNDGIVVTSYHVITQGKSDRLYEEVFFSLPGNGGVGADTSGRYRLQVALINKSYDLALLRIVSESGVKPSPEPATFPSIEIGDSNTVRELDDLIVIGFPEKGGSTVTVNAGMVEGKDILGDWIKTDARLIHGNSGGAAVNTEGKLIGIPTKIVSDEKRLDTDGDGFPDEVRSFGEIGFLRPSLLVALMLGQLNDAPLAHAQAGPRPAASSPYQRKGSPASPQFEPRLMPSTPTVVVRGVIKSANELRPIAGVRVGLIPLGSNDVSPNNLLTWGSTNSDGEFELNNPVPPGRYTLRAKSLRYEAVTRDIAIFQGGPRIIIEMRLSKYNQ
ncbi:MAG: trypsin-like peptidase domain-containing protein [Blastocatellia bacterium]